MNIPPMPEPICEKCNDVLDHQDHEYCQSCFTTLEAATYELIGERDRLKAEAERLEARNIELERKHPGRAVIQYERDALRAQVKELEAWPFRDGKAWCAASDLREVEAERDAALAQVKELAEALEVAKEAMDERRSYVNGGEPMTCWQEMKYGKEWDAEDAKVAAALSRLASDK